MKATWSVTVVYEDAAKREEAVRFCNQLVDRVWGEHELEVNWWSFDQLAKLDSTAEAAGQAARANLIVFAALAENEFPLEIRAWVERWVAARGDREGMLVGLLGENPGDETAENHIYLRKAAHRGGMDYLTEAPEYLLHEIPDSTESYCDRAQCVTSVLDEILRHQPPPPSLV
jgi:hypothetical protein